MEPPKNNGSNWAWLKDLNWPTVVLIVVTGGGNFFETRRVGDETREKAAQEIHALYSNIDDFERRQEQSLANQKIILENQGKELLVQKDLIEAIKNNQVKFLEQRKNE